MLAAQATGIRFFCGSWFVVSGWDCESEMSRGIINCELWSVQWRLECRMCHLRRKKVDLCWKWAPKVRKIGFWSLFCYFVCTVLGETGCQMDSNSQKNEKRSPLNEDFLFVKTFCCLICLWKWAPNSTKNQFGVHFCSKQPFFPFQLRSLPQKPQIGRFVATFPARRQVDQPAAGGFAKTHFQKLQLFIIHCSLFIVNCSLLIAPSGPNARLGNSQENLAASLALRICVNCKV